MTAIQLSDEQAATVAAKAAAQGLTVADWLGKLAVRLCNANRRDIYHVDLSPMSQVMRGQDTQLSTMFSYLSPEERVPEEHPLRRMRPTVYSKNPDRLLEGEIAEKFFSALLDQARAADLHFDEHFSVDRTLIEAWASQKSFQRKDGSGADKPKDGPGNPSVDFHGEKRSNNMHESATDPDCRLARKGGGHEAKLAYCGNVVIENRNGLVVETELLRCNGTAERDAAMLMAERLDGDRRVTLGADKG